MTIDPAASIHTRSSASPSAIAAKATTRPSIAAVSSNSTVKMVGSLLLRTASR